MVKRIPSRKVNSFVKALKLVAIVTALGAIAGPATAKTPIPRVKPSKEVNQFTQDVLNAGRELRTSLRKKGFSVDSPYFLGRNFSPEQVLRASSHPMSRDPKISIRVKDIRERRSFRGIKYLGDFLKDHPEAVSAGLAGRINELSGRFQKLEPEIDAWKIKEVRKANKHFMHYAKRGAGAGALGGLGTLGLFGAIGAAARTRRRRKELKSVRRRTPR